MIGWQEAAKVVAARRRTPRIEWLCSDANPDARLRGKWRDRVVALAEGRDDQPAPTRVVELSADLDASAPDAPRPGVDESVALLRSAKACPFRRPEPG